MIEAYLLFLVIALGLTVTEFRACQGLNSKIIGNGWGALAHVVNKTALRPARHRPLIPWLTFGLFKKRPKLVLLSYLLIKLGSNFIGPFSTYFYIYQVLGVHSPALLGGLIVACLMAGSYVYDYPDAGWEIAFAFLTYLAFPLHILPLLAVAFIWALMRETALYAVIIVWTYTGVFLSCAPQLWPAPIMCCIGVLVSVWAARLTILAIQGEAAHYMDQLMGTRIPLKMNLAEFRASFSAWERWPVSPLAAFVVWMVAFVGIIAVGLADSMLWGIYAVPAAVMIVAGLTFGKWAEIRVFLTPAAILVAVEIIRHYKP